MIVHVQLEFVFTLLWKPCPGSPGIRTQEDISKLRSSNDCIVALLDAASGGIAGASTGALSNAVARAPLAYSQLAHWNLYELGPRPAIRQIASATRLRGKVNVAALNEGLVQTTRRHSALRTRVVVSGGVPMQEISLTEHAILRMMICPSLPHARRKVEVQIRIEQLILEPIEITAGPLFEARLIKISDDEHVLIIVMEHMVSDASSMGILLREIFEIYVGIVAGVEVPLPAVPLQFAQYAVRQQRAQKSQVGRHGGYWNELIVSYQRPRFPSERNASSELGRGWGTVPVHIGTQMNAELRGWCREVEPPEPVRNSVFEAYHDEEESVCRRNPSHPQKRWLPLS